MAKKKEELTLEEAFNKLETVISKMENEDVPLEESFQLYSEGMGLLKDVNDRIDRVEKQVQKMQADGSLAPMPPVGE
ncbi:MAG: exodeoxyribonuclease VII small subunit [Lachnospiraceae bacterium]|jgi:exodeoxyribonuclease VII small subunit|nr:exodeoxyribonuclease VII small subunit [Lachnospiraceae bacterium]MDD7702203.1 exodeoxyribonuclease VII small subunit [Lachnospiraceae bacterium]MDY3300916.1 exodeoxyribonuclease VII small subunit [Lachnospiraceae bacterium]